MMCIERFDKLLIIWPAIYIVVYYFDSFKLSQVRAFVLYILHLSSSENVGGRIL